MTTLPSVSKDDLKKQAEELAAKLADMTAKLQEVEKAEREKQRELERVQENMKLEQLRLASVAKYQKVAVEIVTKLNVKGFKLAGIRPADKHHYDYPVIVVLGAGTYDRDCSVSFERNYRETHPYIVVGSSNKARYPIRKDGTYNVDKIVSTIVERYKTTVAEQEREARRNNNLKQSKALAVKLMKRFSVLRKKHYPGDTVEPNNLYSYERLDGVRLESSPYYPDKVKVELDSIALREEDAAELLEWMIAFRKRMAVKYKEADDE